VIQAADALVVRDVTQHKSGLEMLAAVMGAERKVKAFFAPMIEAAMENKRKAEGVRQAIVARQDEILGPVQEARKTISEKCGAFEAEERRAAEMTRKALEEAALKKQEEERQFEAAMAETEEAAEEALTEPLPPPPVPMVRPEVAKVAGVSTRETWSAEVTDKAALLRWVLESGNLYMVEVNMIQLNSRARAEHSALNIPGVKAVSKLSHAGR
jgi:hypothetical protein